MSVGDCINLIQVNRVVNGLLDTQEFIRKWTWQNQAMLVNESGGLDSYAIPPTGQPSVMTFEFFHSKDRRKRDPLKLPQRGELSTDLRIISVCSFRSDTRSQLTFVSYRLDVRIPCKVYVTIKLFGYIILHMSWASEATDHASRFLTKAIHPAALTLF
jgi:hypothetical protein